MQHSGNKAFITIALLGIVILLSTLLLSSEQLIINYLKLQQLRISHLQRDDLENYTGSLNNSLHCEGNNFKICKLKPEMGRYLTDYNLVFEKFYDCSDSQAALPNQYPDGKMYDGYGFISSSTCFLFPEKFPVRENLYITSTQNYSSNLIATPGFILIKPTLWISENLLIIAGGDIQIDSLKNALPGKNLNVYIKSSAGIVSILEKDPEIQIYDLKDTNLSLDSYIFSLVH